LACAFFCTVVGRLHDLRSLSHLSNLSIALRRSACALLECAGQLPAAFPHPSRVARYQQATRAAAFARGLRPAFLLR
jgi:hypothetical protein